MSTLTPHSQTPMMKQYFDLKSRCPDSILFFRLGDFYEMFGDDARVAAKELDLTLTSRDKSTDNPHNRMPMCGVPHHSSEAYIARLIAKGYKVSICEQVEDPAEAKGLVERDIVRVVTPGTLYEPSMLDESRGNYLCAVYVGDMGAICFADMSTGEISVSEFDTLDLRKMENELSVFSPAEAIFGGDPELCQQLAEFLTAKINCLCQYCDTMFGHDDAFELLGGVFSAERIEALIPAARRAIGGLLSYVKDTQKSDAAHLKPISRNESGAHMELDLNTIRNLELLAILSTGETKGSLLSVLDRTRTPMGRRLLRTWVLRPLLHPDPIKQRLAAVGELHAETVLRGELTRRLRHVADTERLLSRIAYKNASPRDLKLLASSIAAVREIKGILQPVICPALRECAEADDLNDIAELIDGSIMDEPPLSARDGNVFNTGVDAEIDRLRGLLDNSAEALIAIETNERARIGKKLKVGYNKVFGYYIEIPRSSSEDVPGDYIRKQTLANAERFITQELKELESDLLSAKDKLAAIEFRMYNELLEKLGGEAARIQETSRLVAVLDVYCSLAEAARTNNYVCPEIDIGGTINITAGRHPTVELSRTDILFVPNDAHLNWESNRCILLTGPNMAGKSTFMRQIALICIMAQIGSFVPASAAHIGIIDRVFTRIGAQDDLSAGKSTFMVEMSEVADILNSATSRSLIVLDEVGRGTSTYDGMSVARAVLEFCAVNLRAKTLFSTHYHELTALEGEIDGVRNFNISAKKQNDDIIFLRKIIPGPADESYGIEVAGLAGVPESVIARAKEVLRTLESGESVLPVRKVEVQSAEPSQAEIALKKVNPDKLSPLEALNLLYELKALGG